MKNAILIISFFLIACNNSKSSYSPENHELPTAVVGEYYSTEIIISNAVLFKENIGVDISPANSGFKWNPRRTQSIREGAEIEAEDYHYLTISGNPNKTGNVIFHVNGFSMGTMTSGSKIDKKYIIRVIPHSK